MDEAQDMIAEGGPVADEDTPTPDESQPAVEVSPAEPVPGADYPGEFAFYAGSKGPWLAALRTQLAGAYESAELPVDFRAEDQAALVRAGYSASPSRGQWREIFS